MCAVKYQPRPPRGFGWTRDTPDVRDKSVISGRWRELSGRDAELSAPAGSKTDLRESEYLPAVEDACDPNASCAMACAGLVEYFQRRCHGTTTTVSAPFLHHVARRLFAGGDGPVSLRSTLKAMVRIGVPPDYLIEPDGIDQPASFKDPILYAFNADFSDIEYFRIDGRKFSSRRTLNTVRRLLCRDIPCVFGFPVPSSIDQDPRIGYRRKKDSMIGGVAVMAVGYDDRYRVASHRGALLFRSPWGPSWGEGGYGRLPYRFVEDSMACDFWTIHKPSWRDSGEFRPQA
jgi:hypothetical protein